MTPKYWHDGTKLYHYGIPGQKRGVRRFQNPDGTLTEEGKRRYNRGYSERNRRKDFDEFGNGGVRRINKRMNRGMSYKKARDKEWTRKSLLETDRDTIGRLANYYGYHASVNSLNKAGVGLGSPMRAVLQDKARKGSRSLAERGFNALTRI